MHIMIPIFFVLALVAARTWAHEAPYRRELRRKKELRDSVLNWRDRR
jgi:hypothetical protein